MLKYGLKYNIVTTVPLHECVYFYTELPSKTRLSDELLLLNYRSKSPFPETALFKYLYQKVHLFLWFSPLKKYTSLFVVPEGFWVYRILLKQGNGLYAVSQEDGTCLVADIDDHVLRTQYLLPSMEKCGELERRFRKKIIHISSETYNEEYASLLKDPKALLLLRHFANFNLSKQRLLRFLNDVLYKPLIFVMVLYMIISWYQQYTIEQNIAQMTQTYHALRQENRQLNEAVQRHNQTVNRINLFKKEELNRPDPMKILYALKDLVREGEEAKITYVTISDDRMKLRIETKDDAVKYLKRLDAMGYFSEIVIENTYKQKKGLKTYVFAMILKEASR